jgi:aspartate kinase
MANELSGLQVYKFGGASVKDAAAILNLCRIVRDFGPQGPLLIVVSAMGKTTNALEEIYDLARRGNDYSQQLEALRLYHFQVGDELSQALDFTGLPHSWLHIFDALAYRLTTLSPSQVVPQYEANAFPGLAKLSPEMDYDEGYDQIVCYGEILSSYLVYYALTGSGQEVHWRSSPIITDTSWREGKVAWKQTEEYILDKILPLLDANSSDIVVTSGFLGNAGNGRNSTLGREGSDYSAAILAYCLNAESVTIWKDVPGLLNADPKIFPDTVRYPEISYQETIEMAYYGASVIHPKTLKPLADRKIPLRVKSFLDPAAEGTLIHDCQHPPLAPAFIRKTGQYLVSLESKDFAFISEENLEVIFGALAQARLKINVMQNSALSFSVCLDGEPTRLAQAVAALRTQFKVQYNEGLTLFTIKNYTPDSVAQLLEGRSVLLEQRTRSTFQVVVRE